jgi:hypothetical protein
MLRLSSLLILLFAACAAPAGAADKTVAYNSLTTGAVEPVLPAKLKFGYEGEGKVDASPAACLSFAKEFEGSHGADAAEVKANADEVCASRKRHADAYAALQDSYRKMVEALDGDELLHSASSVRAFESMIAACVAHKHGLVGPGKQSVVDMIPNEIAARCLDLGKNLLDEETAFLKGDVDRISP